MVSFLADWSFGNSVIENMINNCIATSSHTISAADSATKLSYYSFVEDIYVAMISHYSYLRTDDADLEVPTQLFEPFYFNYVQLYAYFIFFLLGGFYIVDYCGFA